MKELENDLGPNILKYHQLDIADRNSTSVFSQFIQSEHQGRDSIINPKEGCVFPIFIWSEFRMRQYRDDDHRKDASHFIISCSVYRLDF